MMSTPATIKAYVIWNHFLNKEAGHTHCYILPNTASNSRKNKKKKKLPQIARVSMNANLIPLSHSRCSKTQKQYIIYRQRLTMYFLNRWCSSVRFWYKLAVSSRIVFLWWTLLFCKMYFCSIVHKINHVKKREKDMWVCTHVQSIDWSSRSAKRWKKNNVSASFSMWWKSHVVSPSLQLKI